MNNTIEESYCSFEVSKLLKEKGFEMYASNGLAFKGSPKNLNVHRWYQKFNGNEFYSFLDYHCHNDEISIPAPTHSLATEWIRINFKTWVQIISFNTSKDMRFQYQIRRFEWDGKISNDTLYETPQKAIEAALLHTLQNLI